MRLRLLVAVFAAMVTLGGCATFSLGGGKAIVKDGDTSAEAVFRRQALALPANFERAGWLRSEESQSRTKAFMKILSLGWGHKKASDEAGDAQAPDAVALYLARLEDKNGDDPGKIAIALQADMGQALMAMSELDDSATPLAAPQMALGAEALRTDVKLMEQALIASRKAHSLFASAAGRIGKAVDAALKADLMARLAANERELKHMQVLADSLNSRRLALSPSS